MQSVQTLPADWYSNPKIYELERKNIFAKEWQLLCTEEQLKNSGDYFSYTIAGYPLFVIRDKHGAINGFHNVCRHRANPLVPFDSKGQCDLLRCKYHGWVYDTNGALRACSGFNKEEINKSDYGLFKLRVETWRGLIFVNMDANAKSLKDWLGKIDDECQRFHLEKFRYTRDITRHLKCNWKTYVDNYQEGYHIPTIHHDLNQAIDTKKYKVTNEENSGKFSIHTCPARSSPHKSNDGLWLYVWPNLAINIYQWGMSFERMVPVDLHNTKLFLSVFVKEEEGPDAKKKEEENLKEYMAFTDVVINEDISVCEDVQKNLDSRVYDVGLLSPAWENGVAFFQRMVRKSIGM